MDAHSVPRTMLNCIGGYQRGYLVPVYEALRDEQRSRKQSCEKAPGLESQAASLQVKTFQQGPVSHTALGQGPNSHRCSVATPYKRLQFSRAQSLDNPAEPWATHWPAFTARG